MTKLDTAAVTIAASAPAWHIGLQQVNVYLSTISLILAIIFGLVRVYIMVKSEFGGGKK